MSHGLIVLWALLSAGLAHAELRDAGPCREALTQLEAHESSLTPRTAARGEKAPAPAVDARLTSLRRRAARACLGGTTEASAPLQRQNAPVAVPSVGLTRPITSLPPRLPLPAAPVAAPPTVVTACDAVGCWASDGTRLHRVGPNLQGPRGLCSVQGNVLVCP